MCANADYLDDCAAGVGAPGSRQLGPLVSQKGTFASTTEFLTFFIVGLNSNISYWGSMPLTVTDLTKVAKDQKSQMVGQFAGVPTGIVGLALVGSLVTSCTVVMFGEDLGPCAAHRYD